MKNLVFISLSIFCTFLTSCLPIAYRIHDVRTIEPQSNEELLQFCREKKITLTQLYRVKQDSVVVNMKKHLNKNYLFDRSGRFVNFASQFDNPKCKGNLIAVLENMASISAYPIDSTLLLRNLLAQTEVVGLPNSEFKEVQIPNSEYSVLIYWNVYSGNPNHRTAIADIREIIEKQKLENVSLILVNQDFHEGTHLRFTGKR